MANVIFEWDKKKNLDNQSKHGVSFELAQFAFADPFRVIAQDLNHSATENRYFCFGAFEGEILTVRFTFATRRFASSVPGIGVKENQFMKSKTTYSNEPLGKIKVIDDFLPSPSELAFREEGVKVTLALSKKSVNFFKEAAQKHNTQYQRMIRRLLDSYVEAQEQRPITTRSSGRSVKPRAA